MFRVISVRDPMIVYNKQSAKMTDFRNFSAKKSEFTDYKRAVQTCRRMTDAGKTARVVRVEHHNEMIN